MASLGELIQLAQFQMQNKQMNNPFAQLTGLAKNVMPAYIQMQEQEKAATAATQNRKKLEDLIAQTQGKPGFGYEMDQEGNIKFKYDSSSGKKSYRINDKIVRYDPARDVADVIFEEKDDEESDEETVVPEKKKYNPEDVASWSDVPFASRIAAALTPSATTEEKKLGGLRMGGVLNPPKSKSEATLPPTVKTTKEAVNHLMKNYNMTQEEAVEWIRRKYNNGS